MTHDLDQWVDDPPAKLNAELLNAAEATRCPHGHVRCFVLCGVGLSNGRWRVIPKGRRLRWRRKFLEFGQYGGTIRWYASGLINRNVQ